MEDNEECTPIILTFPKFHCGTIKSEPGRVPRRLSSPFLCEGTRRNGLDKVCLCLLTAASATRFLCGLF